MNCKIDTTPDFARDLKQLAKRYPSIKDDYRDFLDALRKSGGARVITHTVLVKNDGADITLVTIYDKSDQASISNRELRKLMKKNGLE